MDDPPYISFHRPKPGLTKDEKRKVKAAIKAKKMKRCPAMGSKELELLGLQRAKELVASLNATVKKVLAAGKPKKSKEQKRKEHNEYVKAYMKKRYHKDIEKSRAYYRKEAQMKRGENDNYPGL